MPPPVRPAVRLSHERRLAGATLTEATHVCYLHSRVYPPHSYERLAGPHSGLARDVAITSEVYLPVPAAVPATRRFVAAALRSWGLETRGDDARLITSELATNAVSHGMSAFRVRVEHAALTPCASPSRTSGSTLPS